MGSGGAEGDRLLSHQHHREVVHGGAGASPAKDLNDGADLDGAAEAAEQAPLPESPPHVSGPKDDNPYE